MNIIEQYETSPIMFLVRKPTEWSNMPFYKKIAYYKTTLNRLYAPYVDKLCAKKIVKDICGDKIKVANVVKILKSPEDLNMSDLDANHIIKSIHGSGWNINIDKSTNINECNDKLKKWNIPYTINGEKQYNYIKPGFFIEEKINDKFSGKSGNADVYMLRCIRGEPFIISVKRGNIQNNYTLDWNIIDKLNFHLNKPNELDRMIELSKLLSMPFEFVRIDFYISADSDIYFSEFTFTPSAGYQLYSDQIEEKFGALWK